VCAWLASQLAHLTRLRSLNLVGIQAPYTAAGAAALASTLQQLQGLTQLCLKVYSDDEPRIPCPSLNRLTQLSSLDLENVGTPGQPLDLRTLPASLTALRFKDCDVSYTDASSSDSGAAVQLPLLQKLDVNIVHSPRGKCNLQHVCLLLRQTPALSKLNFMGDCCSFLDRASGVLSQLQSLQHIQLWPVGDQLSSDLEAAQLAALTSSSQLTALEFSCSEVPTGAVQHMFPAGRQLPRLHSFCIGDGSKAGWDLEPGDISRIVACCPNLRCLSRPYLGAAIGVGRISSSELQQLRQLTALTSLVIRSPSWDAAAGAVLADMTGGCMI
jgi:hypothetical protein